jgi:hypothetical protein
MRIARDYRTAVVRRRDDEVRGETQPEFCWPRRRKYAQAIDTKVVPPIEDLRVEVIAHGDGDLILIEVPPQSEENKPFLVHGAVIEGKAHGTFFSVVRRRNDEMASTRPANVHANLTVGRAFLRGNTPPLPRSAVDRTD